MPEAFVGVVGRIASPKLGDLLAVVEEYQVRFRHPSLERFGASLPYDYFPERGGELVECCGAWPDTWPNSQRAGIYAFLGENLELSVVVRWEGVHAQQFGWSSWLVHAVWA